MLFNSIDFGIFLPLVFLVYWFVFRKLKNQNIFLLVASYFFYGWWDYRFLSLIIFSSLIDYLIGLSLNRYNNKSTRKGLLIISLIVNLGLLGFFKYYNFFADSLSDAFTFFGRDINPARLNIILPVGISFYTFQSLSYSIDIYRKKIEPTRDIISFLAFVSFFPQLVAGPIERAAKLLPQFHKARHFEREKASDGLRQILWGLFKKIVIADNCALIVNDVFADHGSFSGSTLFLVVILFSFQIYGDFSGYSDIAIGTARLFGFSLSKNFNFPYFALNPADFWRRWHISLTSWFRDYIYLPLGGNKKGYARWIVNVFLVFLISGLWHGANWTFLAWGLVHALLYLMFVLVFGNSLSGHIKNKTSVLISGARGLSIILNFLIISFIWIFFRSESLTQAWSIISEVLSPSVLSLPEISQWGIIWPLLLILSLFLVIEWTGKSDNYAIESILLRKPKAIRWGFYIVLIFIMGMFMYNGAMPFIYFQF